MSETVESTPSGQSVPQAASEEINATIRYTMFSVFTLARQLAQTRSGMVDEVEAMLADLQGRDLVVRGFYDLSGMRADADLMVWWHSPTVEVLQEAYRRLRRTEFGAHLAPTWSAVGLHRPAEFNRGHVPAFMAGEEPRAFVNVYPFVRSYEWYLLPEAERRQLLKEHGLAALPYPDVRANTVSAFALGDYEWLLAFEADVLHRIVDLMRDLRATGARRHVREELPFFTGRRVSVSELVQLL